MTLIDALVQLAAALPDPGQPTFPGICGTFAGFVGGVIAWHRRSSLGSGMAVGSVVGFGVGLLCWVAAIAIYGL